MSRIDTVREILGLPNQLLDELKIIENVRQGFPIDAWEQLAEYSGISKATIATLLGTSDRTLSRRKKQHKPLDYTESDRLYRLARIIAHALEVFESNEPAINWLERPNRALGGAIPLQLLDTDAGTEQVDDLLTRIEYGVYS